MDYQKIFDLYEKLYFHEAGVRENFSARLQIPLAIILSYVSVYALFINGIASMDIDFYNLTGLQWGFFLLAFFSLSLFVRSIIFFIKASYVYTYHFLPPAQEIEQYRNKLFQTYKGYNNCDDLVSKHLFKYLFKRYKDFSSANTKTNDKRADFIRRLNSLSIINAIPLFFAFIMFVFM